MATRLIQSDVFRLDRLFRSDNLPALRLILEMWPDLKRLVELRTLQTRAIVDANVVQGGLRWRLGSRENSQARSGLEKAIDAGVLVLIAPNFLMLEIEKYLPAIADRTGATLSEVEREWELFQAKLHFYQPSSQVANGSPYRRWPRRQPRSSMQEESVWSAQPRFRSRRLCGGCGMRVTYREPKTLKRTFGA
jgi:hypothetical protein